MTRKWQSLALALICGIVLGAGMFALIHRWEPGFSANAPSGGLLIFEDPMHALLHAQLGHVGFVLSALVSLGGGVLLLKYGVGNFVGRQMFVLTLIGSTMFCLSGLQSGFDSIYPSAAVQQLEVACKDGGKTPCISVPRGDR